MTNSSKHFRKPSKANINPISDPEDVTSRLRKSVVAVLAKTDNYKDMVGNTKVISAIADAVFGSIYKKSGKVYYAKFDGSFDNIVENIMFNTKKVCQVEEAKKQIAQAANVIASGESDTITINVLTARVNERLDSQSTRDLDFFESKFKNEVDKVVYAGSGISLKNLPPRKDLLYVDLILVAEGTNNNKDTIPAEELKQRYLTLIGMPLVEEHIPEAIRGVFYDSKLVRIKPGKAPGSIKIVEKGGRLAVRAKAYVYKNRFPREAYVLKDREEKGLLRYSVELAFGQAECSFCQKKFTPGEQYCEHLLLRHQVKDMGFSRVVRDIYFIGGAYTVNPAEKAAVSIEVTDPGDEKVNKKVKSCVNTTDDTGKVGSEAKASQKNINRNNEGGKENFSQNDGGHRMYNYESVEQMLSSPEVSALIEAKATDIMDQERDAFEASLQEVTEIAEAAKAENEALEASLEETKTELDEAKALIASMEVHKRVTDTILELQNAGYKFDSDEEIKAFSDKISEMNEDQAGYVVELMKKTITANEEAEEEAEEDVEQNADEDTEADDLEAEEAEEAEEEAEDSENDDTVEASRKASVNASENKGEIFNIRTEWKERIANLTK